MAKGSIQLPKIQKAMVKAIQQAYPEIGDILVEDLRIAEEESDTTHRLRDSFSWATDKKKSSPGSEAQPSDTVETTTEALTMDVGTKVPYALSVDAGTVSGIKYGAKGMPGNFEELYASIKKWLALKVGMGKADIPEGSSLARYAYKIAKSIEKNGTDAHPFWHQVMLNAPAVAKKEILKSMSLYLGSIPDTSQIIEVNK